ncbi:hypothetical protein NEIG_00121 [Nematocida sp. ERTm5]|nr:hypothetical protein NEIG_00121 [Nematocida sp. ERTm5]
MSEHTLFHVFNVPREAFTQDLLKQSYYTLIKQVHPDKLGTTSTPADAAQFINKAYKALSNDYVRSIYEYSLDNKRNLVEKEIPKEVNAGFTTVLDLEKERIGCNKGLVTPEFLDEILSLEDRIENSTGDVLSETKEYILKEIENCKKNKKDAKALARWRYYNRVLDIIMQKKMIE